jgi:hypothetical protein
MQQHACFTVSSYTASKYGIVPFLHVQCKKYITRMHDEEAATICAGVSTFYSPNIRAQGILTNFNSRQEDNLYLRQFRDSRSKCVWGLSSSGMWHCVNGVNGSRPLWELNAFPSKVYGSETNHSLDIRHLKAHCLETPGINRASKAAPYSRTANTSIAPLPKPKNSHSITRCYTSLNASSFTKNHRYVPPVGENRFMHVFCV